MRGKDPNATNGKKKVQVQKQVKIQKIQEREQIQNQVGENTETRSKPGKPIITENTNTGHDQNEQGYGRLGEGTGEKLRKNNCQNTHGQDTGYSRIQKTENTADQTE